MSRPLSKRQKIYRKYLQTDHWKDLRAKAIARDGGKCRRCESTDLLQVHHLCYRGRYEDSLLEDLETICRECHRKEHGFGPTDFMALARKLDKKLTNFERPTPDEWKALKALMFAPEDIEDFGDIMFHYINLVLAFEREDHVSGWWMDKQKARFWFDRAHRVRQSLKSRALDIIDSSP